MLLNDKVALITGAGRGMGRAMAIEFAKEGAHVAVADIDGGGAEETSIAVRELGRRSRAIQADIGNLSDSDRMVAETVDNLGSVDILVNNAGVTRELDIMDIKEEDWDLIYRVNAKGAFFCLQRVARELIQQGQGGRIINISSIGGKGHAGTSNTAYAGAKGAIIVMTQIAAHQLARHNINVNTICPGTTRTGMLEGAIAQRSQQLGLPKEEVERQMASHVPMGRFNEPEDIASMAVFLAGPGARNITGQAINVDGGVVMH